MAPQRLVDLVTDACRDLPQQCEFTRLYHRGLGVFQRTGPLGDFDLQQTGLLFLLSRGLQQRQAPRIELGNQQGKGKR